MVPSRRSRALVALALPVALALVVASPSEPARTQEQRPTEFLLLGDFPGGLDHSIARGVSADGGVVVGESHGTDGLEAFRWTELGGLEGLGDLPGGSFISAAYAVSGDGTTIVGSSQSTASAPLGQEAFAWTAAGGMVPLGDLPGNLYASVARAASDDGSVLAGTSTSFAGLFDAVYWQGLSGPTSLGDLPGGIYFSDAYGVSGDGTRIVGRGNTDDGSMAFSWTAGTGLVPLGDLTGGAVGSIAFACSADGLVAVGHATDASGQHAVRWVDGSIDVLGDLPGGTVYGRAYACSADGSVVVGTGTTSSGVDAFVWTAADGMRSLRSILEAHGIHDMDAFTSTEASGVSADGTVIVGHGYDASGNPQAWRAVLGDEPPPPDDVPLLATKVTVKRNAKKPERSKLIVEGLFDTGPGDVDLGAPCEVSCGGLLLPVSSLQPLRGGGWRHSADGLKVDLLPAATGSSLVKLKIKRKGELNGLVPEDGPLDLQTTAADAVRFGQVITEKGRYVQGGKGELVDPGLVLTAATVRLAGRKAQRLSLTASLCGPMPDAPPDVTIRFADADAVLVPAGSFVRKGARYRFRGDVDGISAVDLDYGRERLTVKGAGLALGDYPDGSHVVSVRLAVGEEQRDATVRMVSKRKKLRY